MFIMLVLHVDHNVTSLIRWRGATEALHSFTPSNSGWQSGQYHAFIANVSWNWCRIGDAHFSQRLTRTPLDRPRGLPGLPWGRQASNRECNPAQGPSLYSPCTSQGVGSGSWVPCVCWPAGSGSMLRCCSMSHRLPYPEGVFNVYRSHSGRTASLPKTHKRRLA